MPITNNNYTAPAWNNNNPPAIDASELSAISTTLESNQRKIGDTLLTSRTDLGSNYLLCNGEELNSATYPELSAVLPAPSIYDNYINWNKIELVPPPGYTLSTSDVVSKSEIFGIIYASNYYIFFYKGYLNNGSNVNEGQSVVMMYSTSITGPWSARLIHTANTSGNPVNIKNSVSYGGNVYVSWYSNLTQTCSISKIQPPFATSTISNYPLPLNSSGEKVNIIDDMMCMPVVVGSVIYIYYKSITDAPGALTQGVQLSGSSPNVSSNIVKYGNRYFMSTMLSTGNYSNLFYFSSLTSGGKDGSVTIDSSYSLRAGMSIAIGNNYMYIFGNYSSGTSYQRVYRAHVSTLLSSPNIRGFSTEIADNFAGYLSSTNSKYIVVPIYPTGDNVKYFTLQIIDKSTDSITYLETDIPFQPISSCEMNDNMIILMNQSVSACVRKFNAKYLPVVDGAGQNVMIRAK